jgi:hypothetical protein
VSRHMFYQFKPVAHSIKKFANKFSGAKTFSITKTQHNDTQHNEINCVTEHKRHSP